MPLDRFEWEMTFLHVNALPTFALNVVGKVTVVLRVSMN